MVAPQSVPVEDGSVTPLVSDAVVSRIQEHVQTQKDNVWRFAAHASQSNRGGQQKKKPRGGNHGDAGRDPHSRSLSSSSYVFSINGTHDSGHFTSAIRPAIHEAFSVASALELVTDTPELRSPVHDKQILTPTHPAVEESGQSEPGPVLGPVRTICNRCL